MVRLFEKYHISPVSLKNIPYIANTIGNISTASDTFDIPLTIGLYVYTILCAGTKIIKTLRVEPER